MFAVQNSQQLRERDWSATRNPLEINSRQSFIRTAPHQQGSAGPLLHDGKSNEQADANQEAVLKATLDEMANFVLLQMPEQSFQVLKEIEEITSLQVLAATLGGYEQMLSSTGPDGAEHLLRIKSILREHL